jgi:hypothetical protein
LHADVQALRGEQAFHAIADAHAVLRGSDEFAVQLPTMVGLFTGDPDQAQRAGFPRHVPEQQREEALDIEPVGLRLAGAAIHFDAGRVDDQALHAQRGEIAMEPEAVGPGFVAGHHPRVGRQAELRFRRRDLVPEPAPLVAADRPTPRPLSGTDRKAQSPLARPRSIGNTSREALFPSCSPSKPLH